MNDFDLETFQKKVLDQYYVVKRIREKELEFRNMPENPADMQSTGWLNQFFYKSGVKFARKALSRANERRDTARQLLSNHKVREAICSGLLPASQFEADDEKQQIRNIVNILIDDSVIKENSIPLDTELFGFLCDEILYKGIEGYCHGVGAGEQDQPPQ